MNKATTPMRVGSIAPRDGGGFIAGTDGGFYTVEVGDELAFTRLFDPEEDHTLGDENASWGWVPAVDLQTSDGFDANPSAQGLKQCAAPLPPLPASCDVHSDGKLHCVNKAHAAMYASPHLGSGVVNHLETTASWFKCWGTGDLHAGGNTTWYYTLGDDNTHWGWAPAVELSTPSSFDADPGAYGLPHCN